ncbi:MAG TPA: prepilin-type N-terminal cleavage/methylation domain-containing protein [Gemmatimonadaceae bacterium]|jgi:prepilin-type N-terminal cleavage/methylation domain-containing protein|nr:prepilin-type N-terminal cleavage/methylation domain-containing protein [Gemmatimonadaceae bacterium]
MIGLRSSVGGPPVRGRGGFTLIEMAIVLAIMAVSAMLVAPALSRMGQGKPPAVGDDVIKLLTDARTIAISRNETVTLRLDPVSGRYRADTVGVSGSGELGEGAMTLGAQEVLVTDLPRLVYVFHPTGSTFADTVLVRGAGSSVLVSVDPWNGVAYAASR